MNTHDYGEDEADDEEDAEEDRDEGVPIGDATPRPRRRCQRP